MTNRQTAGRRIEDLPRGVEALVESETEALRGGFTPREQRITTILEFGVRDGNTRSQPWYYLLPSGELL